MTPTPEPGVTPTPEPGVRPTPEPGVAPTPRPAPVVLPALPDPNDPESPEVVMIMEEDVPLTYLLIWDTEKEEYAYILDEDTPLANVPETGDEGGMWLLTAFLSAAGLLGLVWQGRKKEEA